MSQKVDAVPIALLTIAALLTPVIGGGVNVEAQPVEPGFAATLSAVMGGRDLPLLSHALLLLPVAVALIWVWLSSRVVQVPAPAITYSALAFAAFLVLGLMGPFPFSAQMSLVEYYAYVIAFFAAVAALGRDSGPRRLIMAIFAGSALVAASGVMEYLVMSARDPSWRIFGTWMNPNALAAMLLIGFFCGVGVVFANLRRPGKETEGPMRALAVIALGAIVAALVLTQSRGAYLALLVGVAGVLISFFFSPTGARRAGHGLASTGIALALGIVLAIGLTLAAPTKSGGALGRVTQMETTQEQSAGFRTNLWRGAVALIQENPIGHGLGSYRFVSAKPGLTTQTQFTHNSYLQLAVEGGVIALGALIALVLTWTIGFFRGARHGDPRAAPWRAAVLGSVMAIGAHSMIDSDLSYFGIGFSIFLLMGVGLLLSVDGVTPETRPRPMIPVAVGFTAAALLFMWVFAIGESHKARARYALLTGEPGPASEAADRALGITPGDPEAAYLRALATPDPSQRLAYFQRATTPTGWTKFQRAYARELATQGKRLEALNALDKALWLDPNNLPALWLKTQFQSEVGNHTGAVETARRLVAIERTPYFQVRSIPEIVPTETYEARIFLARSMPSSSERTELLRGAVEGFQAFAQRTVPQLVALGGGYGGVTPRDADAALELGMSAAELLRESGDTGTASTAISTMSSARSDLAKLLSK